MLLVHHPAPWSPWSPWSTLIHLGPQIPECGYTKWSKQDQGGPGVVQGHQQDHGAGWWTRSVQDHCGPLKNFFLMRDVPYAGVKLKSSPKTSRDQNWNTCDLCGVISCRAKFRHGTTSVSPPQKPAKSWVFMRPGRTLYRREADIEPNNLPQAELEYL